ncbi:small subunit ribosomal protein S1 [Pilibacter termitis]|uniref:Small subunit ribosomal protein S1 n=1 Tax=Pilibacter termitis TaxID=263852 RepID=A0A1T4N4L2_9ENTE|nr:30S ribosomal protein S1 [Pilibacter termitis]SJZ74249.1 small subunit ribosomal protein S1 [Pilibacter termitis]
MSENFEALLNEQEEIKVGDVVEAEVVQIEDKQLVVSLPNGLQGAVPVRELTREKDVELNTLASVGDKFELLVAQEVRGNAKDEGYSFILSKTKLAARKAWEELVGRVGEVVTVKVTKVVKGGLSVDYNGLRGFIPASLVEDRFVSDFSKYKGESFDARIEEVDAESGRLILNRRDILAEEKAKKQAEVFATLHEGDVVEGTVARLTDFGAFISLGGVDGLVHVSEIAHTRVNRPSDVLKAGEAVQAKVLNIDEEHGRVSLSIKATQPGPWSDIEEKAPVGASLDGVVKRLTTFGAFVEVFPGVEGLVHISQISHKHISTPQEVLSEGDDVQVKVLEVNPEAKRIALSIKALEEAPARTEEVEEDDHYEIPEAETGFSLGDLAEGLSDYQAE